MSHTKKSIQDTSFDSLTNRVALSDSLSLNDDNNKPDFKELDLGSPVSPLITRGFANNANAAASAATSSSSSSSSSSGSASGKTNNNSTTQLSNSNNKYNLSEELSGSPGSGPTPRSLKAGHRRSVSAGPPLIYSGSSFSTASSGSSSYNGNGTHSVSSNPNITNVLPSGNICPSGKILKTGMACRVANKTDTLGTGTGLYGHGSIVRGTTNSSAKLCTVVVDAEEVKRAGNEMYKKGNFVEALKLYDKAISMSPENAAYRSNRAAALTAIGRLTEAVSECEEAVRLDTGYSRAHQRLVSLYFRLGQVEHARRHLCYPEQYPDPTELQKLQLVEKHLSRCAEGRKIGDWKSVLRESNAAISIGVDSSPQLVACKAEAHLKLHQIEDADSSLSNMPKFEQYAPPSQTKYFGMVAEAYVLYVQAQVEMALGRFENAVSAAEKAEKIDYSNPEITMVLNNIKMVVSARTRGNDLFSSGRYAEACTAYGEGLRYDSCNPVLYCNRAVCWSKLGLWQKSIEDCNEALRIQPNYTKAILRRAVSNEKLGRWAEAVRDYEDLRRELPGDNEVAESLHHAQIALKKACGEFVRNVKMIGEVEEISSLEKFKTAISSPGVSVVLFKEASSEKCEEISPFVNMLCVRYTSVHFFKVDVEECLAVAKAEGIRTVPTFKIYKNGDKVKEMIRPSHLLLEDSVSNYSL